MRVAPECPHLLEHRVELVVTPGGDPDSPALETRTARLAVEQPEAVRRALNVASSRLHERNGIELDDGHVEPPPTKVFDRGDEPRVHERAQGDHERSGRERSSGDDV